MLWKVDVASTRLSSGPCARTRRFSYDARAELEGNNTKSTRVQSRLRKPAKSSFYAKISQIIGLFRGLAAFSVPARFLCFRPTCLACPPPIRHLISHHTFLDFDSLYLTDQHAYHDQVTSITSTALLWTDFGILRNSKLPDLELLRAPNPIERAFVLSHHPATLNQPTARIPTKSRIRAKILFCASARSYTMHWKEPDAERPSST
jgi:hypothetical protein